jgi:poly(A) polymerase
MTKKVLSAIDLGISNQMVNPDAMNVIRKLQQQGFDGYIVGGGTRDLLLSKKPKDFDIVTNATPEMVKKIFKRNSIIIGRRFKIVHVVFDNLNFSRIINNRPAMEKHIIEISTYRSLKINQHSLNEYGKIMVDNNYGTQKDDATRRDFTINALYYDPIKEVVIDYHDGINDLKKKMIRLIGDPEKRYIEDPVRILRAIRLSVKLALDIEASTANYMEEFKPLLVHEHRSRMYEEMLKILLSGSSSKCIQQIKDFDLPKEVFMLFDRLFLCDNPDALSLRVLEKTDERLQTENAVSTIFILASLMWNMVNNSYQKLLPSGESPHQALMEAIFQNRGYANEIGITKNAYSAMTDVWLLQYEFENPTLRKIDRTLGNSRFRQSLHLYNLRNEFGEVDSKLNEWWNSLVESIDPEEKLTLIDNLKKVFQSSKPKKTRKKKAIPEHKRLDKAR